MTPCDVPPSPRSPPTARRLWRSSLPALALALAGCLAAGLSGCAALDEQQRRWIFQPSDRTWAGGLAAAQGMQDVWIEFDAGKPEAARSGQGPAAPPDAAGDVAADPAGRSPVRLHGLWLPQPSPDAPVLLYLHGARWDVRGSAHRMRRMHELGFAVLGVDYRGFGQSTQALPSEQSAVEDAHAAWHWLGRQWPQSPRYVFGHSLGGAVAVQLAAQLSAQLSTRAPPGLAGLIVEGSFTSVPDVYSTLSWGWLPLQPLITQRFDAARQIADVAAPVLVVHGSDDRLISPELGRALFERAREPKRFVLVPGGSHHNTNALGQGQVREAMAELFGLAPMTRTP